MLELIDVKKTFEGKTLLSDISFKISRGEIVCLLGSSGSGKSTLLRLIAGLETVDSGKILWNGTDLREIPSYKRNFGFMFQDYALFTHMNVYKNIAFGLKMKKWPETETRNRVMEVAELTNLVPFLERGVQDLSGGEQQRVALARSLAPHPELMMLDEPLGALDRKLKEKLLDDLRLILKKSQLPTIYVTHDQGEAFTVADRIILLHDSHIAQDATPRTIYEQPANEWVARFMGLGNVVSGVITVNGLDTGNGCINLPLTQPIASKIKVLLRPEVEIVTEKESLQGIVTDVLFSGSKFKIEIDNRYHFLVEEMPEIGKSLKIKVLKYSIL
jgi:ABC-type Fe3+/spermidine/putrescine transport system ATPase subunit